MFSNVLDLLHPCPRWRWLSAAAGGPRCGIRASAVTRRRPRRPRAPPTRNGGPRDYSALSSNLNTFRLIFILSKLSITTRTVLRNTAELCVSGFMFRYRPRSRRFQTGIRMGSRIPLTHSHSLTHGDSQGAVVCDGRTQSCGRQ